MTFKKENYCTEVAWVKDLAPGFREAYALFEQRVVLDSYI